VTPLAAVALVAGVVVLAGLLATAVALAGERGQRAEEERIRAAARHGHDDLDLDIVDVLAGQLPVGGEAVTAVTVDWAGPGWGPELAVRLVRLAAVVSSRSGLPALAVLVEPGRPTLHAEPADEQLSAAAQVEVVRRWAAAFAAPVERRRNELLSLEEHRARLDLGEGVVVELLASVPAEVLPVAAPARLSPGPGGMPQEGASARGEADEAPLAEIAGAHRVCQPVAVRFPRLAEPGVAGEVY
jgi:hypothetical protein